MADSVERFRHGDRRCSDPHLRKSLDEWASFMWHAIDRNRKGFITNKELDCQEFRNVLRAALTGGASNASKQVDIDNAIRLCLRKADMNNDEVLSFPEFRSLMRCLRTPKVPRHTANLVFALFDLDGNGYLGREEFHELFRFLLGRNPGTEEFEDVWHRLVPRAAGFANPAEYVDQCTYKNWFQSNIRERAPGCAPRPSSFGTMIVDLSATFPKPTNRARMSSDAKTKLRQFPQKYLERDVTKQDAVYKLTQFSSFEFQAVVSIECLDGEEFAGEVCADRKAAENSAAEQVLVANEDLVELVESTLAETGGTKRKMSTPNPAEKRAKADDGAPDDNPAITPKTQLNSLVMKIIKRFLQKGETVYDCKKVNGLYQATVTLSALPGEWGERAWVGHLCQSKKKAEQSAADEALKDLQQDPELQEEAAKPKGGGRGKWLTVPGEASGKGKRKGKFGPMAGWDMTFEILNAMMLASWQMSSMGLVAPRLSRRQ